MLRTGGAGWAEQGEGASSPAPPHSRSAPHRHREAGHCLHGGALTWVLGAGQSGCGCGQSRQEVAREMPNLNCMQSWDYQGHGEPGTPP